MLVKVFPGGVLAAVLVPAVAQAGPIVEATVNNKTGETIEFRSRAGDCTGAWDPAFQDIAQGMHQVSRVESPFPTSVSCAIDYRRTDNRRGCKYVISRVRSSLTGPWNQPSIVVTGDAGANCSYEIHAIKGDVAGSFRVLLGIE